jgi:tripartite-type tricarboxylate transporter receptor subunit TctC
MGMKYVEGAWRGITVPKGTPAEVVAVLEKSVEKAHKSAQFREFMAKNGYGLLWRPAADFDQFLASEDKSKGELMKAAGITK